MLGVTGTQGKFSFLPMGSLISQFSDSVTYYSGAWLTSSFHFPPLWVGPLAAPPCMVPATHQSQPPISMSQLHTTKRALP